MGGGSDRPVRDLRDLRELWELWRGPEIVRDALWGYIRELCGYDLTAADASR